MGITAEGILPRNASILRGSSFASRTTPCLGMTNQRDSDEEPDYGWSGE